MVGEEGTIPSPVRWLAEPPSYGRQGDLIDDLMDTTLRKEEERGGEGAFLSFFFQGRKLFFSFPLRVFYKMFSETLLVRRLFSKAQTSYLTVENPNDVLVTCSLYYCDRGERSLQ